VRVDHGWVLAAASTAGEGVEMLDVAMAEYVVAVRREPFSGLYDQAS
jgi:hypothetical protein